LLDYEIVNSLGTPWTDPSLVAVGCEGIANRCLRYSVGTLNAGAGDLWVMSPKPPMGGPTTSPVYQRVYKSASGITSFNTYTMPSSVSLVQDSHPHLHFPEWTKTTFRYYNSSCSNEVTATNCALVPNVTSKKLSFCLENYRAPTVPQVETNVPARQQWTGCSKEVTESGVVYRTQGISAGYMDTYRKALVGQMIGIDGVPAGEYWLEVEVNPNQYLRERDYSNNISRVKVTIP
jgi:hypothetical protein